MNTVIDCCFLCREEEADRIAAQAEAWFRYAESKFSRFMPNSELARLNRMAGKRCFISEAMLEVLLLSQSYRSLTGGAFEPLILPALREAGYMDTFDQMAGIHTSNRADAELQPIADSYVLDPAMKSVVLPPQTEIDLGGIVKSWTAKRLAAFLRETADVNRGYINAGGDLTVWSGPDAAAQTWTVGIENPWRVEADFGFLELVNGSAATSSTLGRRWMTSRGTMHHLIDPRTMLPSSSDAAQCTVTGPDAVECEIWAKTICILGVREGFPLFSRKTAGRFESLAFTLDRETYFCGEKSSLGTRWRDMKPDHVYDTEHIHHETYRPESEHP
ncbi:FAD:protein FMN transferase [Paenibacillus thalictri]|nr:FAD:protein FMN transferase [Paenibacillus thalictri]